MAPVGPWDEETGGNGDAASFVGGRGNGDEETGTGTRLVSLADEETGNADAASFVGECDEETRTQPVSLASEETRTRRSNCSFRTARWLGEVWSSVRQGSIHADERSRRASRRRRCS